MRYVSAYILLSFWAPGARGRWMIPSAELSGLQKREWSLGVLSAAECYERGASAYTGEETGATVVAVASDGVCVLQALLGSIGVPVGFEHLSGWVFKQALIGDGRRPERFMQCPVSIVWVVQC